MTGCVFLTRRKWQQKALEVPYNNFGRVLADAEDINPSGDVQMEWDMVEAFLDWLD